MSNGWKIVNDELDRCGRKLSWPILMYCSRIYLEY